MTKHFIITKGGIARLMEADDSVVDPMDEVAKWHADDQALVTASRAIDLADLPADRDWWAREGWEDDGANITVNMTKVRAAFEQHLDKAKLIEARGLLEREMVGEDVTSDKARLRAFSPNTAAASTPAALRALWPQWLL